jgi:hypothetical protein
LLLRDDQFAEQILSGTFFETDYAPLLAALAWEATEPTGKACFPGGGIFGFGGGLILGEPAEKVGNVMPRTRQRWLSRGFALWSSCVIGSASATAYRRRSADFSALGGSEASALEVGSADLSRNVRSAQRNWQFLRSCREHGLDVIVLDEATVAKPDCFVAQLTQ